MAELDHRVKNTLANIQALVVQTSRSADTLTGFVEGLDGRIQSMAKAHSLLSESRWEGVSISRLLHEELDMYGERNHGITMHGPDFLLTSKSALALSLAVHELATNAAKFGAFSTTAGRVEVTWKIVVNGGIEFCWRESGGLTVVAPTRRGFGSTLIERALAMETGGGATISYSPTGVVCEVSLPASSISTLALAPALPEVVATGVAMSATIDDAYRVLIVEDSFLLVMVLEDLFDRLGWKIIGPAARVDEALQLARTEDFDAALVDINLAGEMSWPVAAVLTERGIPFALSSGYNVDTLLPASLQGTELIGKPYRPDAVERCIRHIIANHRSGEKRELAMAAAPETFT